MNIFQRAASYAPLQPVERALLKLIEASVVAGVVAALPVVSQLLSQQQIDWSVALRTAAGTFSMAVLLAALKYAKAHMDPTISAGLAAVEQVVAPAHTAPASLLQAEATDSAL